MACFVCYKFDVTKINIWSNLLALPGSVADISAPNRRHSRKSKSDGTVPNFVKAYNVKLQQDKRNKQNIIYHWRPSFSIHHGSCLRVLYTGWCSTKKSRPGKFRVLSSTCKSSQVCKSYKCDIKLHFFATQKEHYSSHILCINNCVTNLV